MEWKDVGSIIGKSAPILGAIVGGPVGAIAGAAGSLIASCLGVDSDPATVAATLTAKPELAVRLKEIEEQHQARLLEWQTAQLNAEVTDRQGARAREVELAKTGMGAAWATTVVATLITIGFFVMLYYVLSRPAGEEPGQAAFMLLGTLAAGFTQVINYYLGSSFGSQQKTNLLAQAPSILSGVESCAPPHAPRPEQPTRAAVPRPTPTIDDGQ